VITGHDDHGVVALSGFLESLQECSKPGVKGLHFTEVIGNVLANFGDIREVAWKFSLQGVGVDLPEAFS
jgi:hypothetical protein